MHQTAKPFDDARVRVANGADHHGEAAALVEQMTLDEKLGCLDGDTPFWPGIVDMTNGGYYRHPWPAAVVERLGIPGIQFADGPRGAVIADGTAFPVSMARGALFDPLMEERVGDAIGAELRASGATYTGAVCMNLLRHPAWGRAQETYGEDPHHVGRMAAAFTRGLQRHALACMKHFAANSMENARFTVDVEADERALHEVYLPHFRHVADEGVASVMSAYNSLNGEWCGENATLLSTILRDEWEWDGFVISDFIFGLRDPVKSVIAGLDIEMPFRQQRATVLADAVADGRLEVAAVDRAVQRIVATLLRFGHVLDAVPDPSVINSPDHRALARTVSAAATVMLRNEASTLPADPASRVTVLGRLASIPNLGDGGSSDVKSTTVVTPLAGIEAAFEHVAYFPTLDSESARATAEAADLVVVVVGYTKDDEGEFIDDSTSGDLAGRIFPPMDHAELGFPPAEPTRVEEERAATEGEPPTTVQNADSNETEVGAMARGGDRVSLRLSAADEELIAAAAAANGRVVVAVQCGSAVIMPWAGTVPTVLISWYPGVEGGNALADVLTGASEPGGRLPFAIATDESHLVHFDKDATHEVYGLLHGQWKLDADGNEAHFPFGAGAGYTTFSLDSVALETHDDDAADAVSVQVTNTGERAGSTVVFAYGGLENSSVERPPRRLIGFRRVDLDPGAGATVRIELDWAQLDVRRDGGWWTEPGTYRVAFGFDAHSLPEQIEVARP